MATGVSRKSCVRAGSTGGLRSRRSVLRAAGGRNSLIWKCSWGTGRPLSHPGQVWPEGGGRGVSLHVSAPRWEAICRGGLAAEHPKAGELGERSSRVLDWIPCPSPTAPTLPQSPEGDGWLEQPATLQAVSG